MPIKPLLGFAAAMLWQSITLLAVFIFTVIAALVALCYRRYKRRHRPWAGSQLMSRRDSDTLRLGVVAGVRSGYASEALSRDARRVVALAQLVDGDKVALAVQQRVFDNMEEAARQRRVTSDFANAFTDEFAAGGHAREWVKAVEDAWADTFKFEELVALGAVIAQIDDFEEKLDTMLAKRNVSFTRMESLIATRVRLLQTAKRAAATTAPADGAAKKQQRWREPANNA